MLFAATFLALTATVDLPNAKNAPCSPQCATVTAQAAVPSPSESTEAKTANFIIRCSQSVAGLPQLAERCELLRTQLQEKWLGRSQSETWKPPCEVVLHLTRASYLCEVGRQGSQTSGASSIGTRAGVICARRIDLLADGEGHVPDALPHELTHVVLADLFPTKPPPPWVDEGMAVLADCSEKQLRHQRDLEAALRKDVAFSVTRLCSLTCCPHGEQRATFYGQSVSLVRFLVERRTPEHFVTFVQRATAVGYDYALKEVYQIDGTFELDRVWRTQVVQEIASSPPARQQDERHVDALPIKAVSLTSDADGLRLRRLAD